MSVIYPTSDNIISGTPYDDSNMTSGDTLVIGPDISIVSTEGDAVQISDLTEAHIQNFGLIASNNDTIYAYNPAANYTIYNGESGRILSTGTSYSYALFLEGAQMNLTNAGEITVSGDTFTPSILYHDGNGTLVNTGLISNLSMENTLFGAAVGLYGTENFRGMNSGTIISATTGTGLPQATFYADGATETLDFTNSGLISGGYLAFASKVTTSETVTNSGTMDGHVSLSDTVSGTFVNSGTVLGDIMMQGGDDRYESIGAGVASGIVSGGAGNDTLIGGTQADQLSGGADADMIRGGDGDDTLVGDAGLDTLQGGEGADHMEGGYGSDIYYVDNTGDMVTETAAGAGTNDEVRSTISFALGSHVEHLTLLGQGALDGFGNAGANRLTGNGGDNHLSGRGGSDTLIGGEGDDRLRGGGGEDLFVFADDFGTDRILGFDAADGEKIDLSGVTAIISFYDLINNHLYQVNGEATIIDGANRITILGVDAWQIGYGLDYAPEDFVF